MSKSFDSPSKGTSEKHKARDQEIGRDCSNAASSTSGAKPE
jgi:hypothetical protein